MKILIIAIAMALYLYGLRRISLATDLYDGIIGTMSCGIGAGTLMMIPALCLL